MRHRVEDPERDDQEDDDVDQAHVLPLGVEGPLELREDRRPGQDLESGEIERPAQERHRAAQVLLVGREPDDDLVHALVQAEERLRVGQAQEDHRLVRLGAAGVRRAGHRVAIVGERPVGGLADQDHLAAGSQAQLAGEAAPDHDLARARGVQAAALLDRQQRPRARLLRLDAQHHRPASTRPPIPRGPRRRRAAPSCAPGTARLSLASTVTGSGTTFVISGESW